MFEPIAEKVREYVSRKALDIAETLPKFQGGRIYHMQLIREHERKIADQLTEKSKQPNDADIKVRSITLVFCYEFEQFSSVHKSLKRAFPGNKRLLETIDEIRKREDKIDGASWSNLGTIVGEARKYLLVDAIKRTELPADIERIHLSHHRLLPSLACLEFTIIVAESFQKKIRSAAERYYLPKTISASLRPSKLFRGHSMSYETGAEHAVSEQLQKFVNESSRWLLRNLKINSNHVHICAAHPLYQIVYPSEEALVDYAKAHNAWLSKYGYRDTAFHGYHSDTTIFCPAEKHDDLSPRIDPLFFIEHESEYFWLLIDGLLKGMVSSSALLTRLAVYKSSIETLRSKGLMDLTAKWKVIRRSGETVYKLKHVILRLNRALSEFQKSKPWLRHSFDEAANLKTVFAGQESTFSSNMLGFVESELKSLAGSAIMLDQALSDRLATENIYVMYQLQRRVFWLTVVGVCIAAVGLVSAWDKIEKYINLLLTGGV